MLKLTGSKVLFIALILVIPPLVSGQAPAPVSFEVASIKPAAPITASMLASGKLHVGMSIEGTRVDIGYLSLSDLIQTAFRVKSYQVSGPDWMTGQRFDILARMPEGSTKEQVPEMLQSLLAERFQLQVRRETREHPVYALVVGKGGPKLKESPPDAEAPAPENPQNPGITVGTGDGQVRINNTGGGATVVTGNGGATKMSMGPDGQMRMEMSKMTMPAFAELLARLSDRPVMDLTELRGNYQIVLDLTMTDLVAVARASGATIPALGARGNAGRLADASDPSGSSVFASVQQLGLKLDPRKAPAETIVVEHLEKTPTEN
jgi:uncharacterized protein (TIGR03435 family)